MGSQPLVKHLSIMKREKTIDGKARLEPSEHLRLLFIVRVDCMLAVPGHLYALSPRSVIVLPAGAEGDLVYGRSCHYIELSLALGEEDPLGLQSQITRLCRGLTHLRFASTKFEALTATLIRLSDLIAMREDLGKAAYARLYDLIVDLVAEGKSAVEETAHEASSGSHLARDVKAYIDLAFTEQLSLKSLASRFYVSEAHLCRAFKSEIGRRPFEYINDLRIKRAADLLQSGHSIRQARDGSGFHTDQHFYKEFKRRMGTAPGKYRDDRAYLGGLSLD